MPPHSCGLFRNLFPPASALIFLVLLIGFSGCDSEESRGPWSTYHPPVWMTIQAEGSHGDEVLTLGLQECLKCHGDDLTGGISEVSCFECHGGGQDNCVACHGGLRDNTGAPPHGLRGEIDFSTRAVGAHEAHTVDATIFTGMECVACHIVPDVSWDSAHFDYSLFGAPEAIDSIAEVTWNTVDTTVMWNRRANSCFNSYCHGNFTGGFISNTPYWIGTDQAACGSCHDVGSNPGFIDRLHSSHAGSEIGCEQCHATVVDANVEVIGPQFHVDGLNSIEFPVDSGGVFIDRTCSELSLGCHEARDWN